MRSYFRRFHENLVARYKSTLTVEFRGSHISFDTRSEISKRWFYPRYIGGRLHEESVLCELSKYCSSDVVFFDIGANIGFYTIMIAITFGESQVHAFELDPELVLEIRQNVVLNGLTNTYITCAAVWSEGGLPFAFASYKNIKATNQVLDSSSLYGTNVASIRLDDYCQKYNVVPSLAKIDVEGAEVRVLRGMKSNLANIETLFLEVHPSQLRRYHDSLEDLLDILVQAGYSYIELINNHRQIPSRTELSSDEVLSLDKNVMLICRKL